MIIGPKEIDKISEIPRKTVEIPQKDSAVNIAGPNEASLND